jgi:membrane protein
MWERIRSLIAAAVQSAWEGVVALCASDDLTYAASIAYFGLVAFFPMVLLALSILGSATTDVGQRNTVLGFVLQFFPRQFDFIANQVDAFRNSRVTLGVSGTAALVWVAFGVFNAINTAVNYVWGVEKQAGFWAHKFLSFILLLFACSIVIATLLLVIASQVVAASWFSGVLLEFPGLIVLRSFAIRYATTLLVIVVTGIVFWFVPNTRVRFRDVWAGALVTGILWRIAFGLFSWLLGNMTEATMINGSITAVVAFLVWIYVQAGIFLYGVEFTAAYAKIRQTQRNFRSAVLRDRQS